MHNWFSQFKRRNHLLLRAIKIYVKFLLVDLKMVHQIENLAEFEKLVINADPNKLVVVDFWATWCGPCVYIAPALEELSKEFSDVLFFKVDVDKNNETSTAQGIRSGSWLYYRWFEN